MGLPSKLRPPDDAQEELALDPGSPAAGEGGREYASRERARWIARHVLPHEPALRSWLKRRLAPGQEADDIIQETYAVLSSLPAVAHVERPRAYAFQVAWSLSLQQVRRARIAPMETLETASFDPPGLDPSPEQQASARDELRNVAAAIDRLPKRCREAFLLRRLEGLSQRDISARMRISESTVEKHLARALRELVRAFRDDGQPVYAGPRSARDA